jgi:hypothetical protein
MLTRFNVVKAGRFVSSTNKSNGLTNGDDNDEDEEEEIKINGNEQTASKLFTDLRELDIVCDYQGSVPSAECFLSILSNATHLTTLFLKMCSTVNDSLFSSLLQVSYYFVIIRA